MIQFMLDSNVCIAAMRAQESALADRLDLAKGTICISTVVLHELLHGAERSARAEYQRGRIAALTSLLKVFDFGSEAAQHSGQIHATLAKAGNVIGAYDMLIAGHARSLDLTLITNNLKEFARVEGLRCEDWLA